MRAHEADDQVVQVGQQFVRRKVEVGERAYRGAQAPHRRRRVDAVPGHVPDDQCDPRSGERNHVEPVAADTGGGIRREVPRGHLQSGPSRQFLRQQVPLHGTGRGALAGESARVVDAHRRTGDEFLGETYVVVLERAQPPGPGERRHAQGDAARPHRDHHHRAGVVIADGGAQRLVLGHPRTGGVVQSPFHEGPALQQTAGHGRRGCTPDRLPHGQRRLGTALPHRLLPRAPDDGRHPDRPGCGLLTPHDRVQQVDGDEVGHGRHGVIGKFLRGPRHVQGAADAGSSIVEQGQAFLGPPPLGDVDDHVPDTRVPTMAVLHGEEGGRDRTAGAGGGVPGAAVLEVHHRSAGLQDPAHPLLKSLGLRLRQHLRHPPPQPPFERDLLVQWLVHPDVPQVGVEHGDADRRVCEERSEHQPAHPAARHPPEGPFRRPADEPAEHQRGGRGDQDSRDHFVDARLEGTEQRIDLLPQQHRGGARHDPGHGPRPGHARPVQREEDDRPEGGPEARPGVGDDAQQPAAPERDHEGHQGHDDDGGAADPDQCPVGGTPVEERVVEVLRESDRRHEELTVRGRDDRGQYGDQHHPGTPGIEQCLAQADVHRLGVVERRAGPRDSHQADERGADEHDDDPPGFDAPGRGDGLGAADAHEAGQDVRLTEIAEAPGEQRDDRDGAERPASRPPPVGEVDLGAHVQQARCPAVEGVAQCPEAAQRADADSGEHEQGEEHQRALHHVRQAHGEEATQARVDDDDQGGQSHSQPEPDIENVLEQESACHQPTGDVDGEEDESDRRGDHPKHPGAVLEPLFQIGRQAHGVPGSLGVGAQPRRDEQPVEVGTDHQTDRDPAGAQTGRVHRSGKGQEQPAGHVAGSRGQGGDEGTEPAAPQGEVGKGVGATGGPDTCSDHDGHIDEECSHDRRTRVEHFAPLARFLSTAAARLAAVGPTAQMYRLRSMSAAAPLVSAGAVRQGLLPHPARAARPAAASRRRHAPPCPESGF